MKYLFGAKEEAVFGYAYPIFVNKKRKGTTEKEHYKIGSVTLLDKMPIPPDAEEDVIAESRKEKIVLSLQKKYLRRMTMAQFDEIRNKILTGDKNDFSETN